jgi:hypothetical protein
MKNKKRRKSIGRAKKTRALTSITIRFPGKFFRARGTKILGFVIILTGLVVSFQNCINVKTINILLGISSRGHAYVVDVEGTDPCHACYEQGYDLCIEHPPDPVTCAYSPGQPGDGPVDGGDDGGDDGGGGGGGDAGPTPTPTVTLADPICKRMAELEKSGELQKINDSTISKAKSIARNALASPQCSKLVSKISLFKQNDVVEMILRDGGTMADVEVYINRNLRDVLENNAIEFLDTVTIKVNDPWNRDIPADGGAFDGYSCQFTDDKKEAYGIARICGLNVPPTPNGSNQICLNPPALFTVDKRYFNGVLPANPKFLAAVLLHEVAHLTQSNNHQHDTNSQAASDKYNELIRKYCNVDVGF